MLHSAKHELICITTVASTPIEGVNRMQLDDQRSLITPDLKVHSQFGEGLNEYLRPRCGLSSRCIMCLASSSTKQLS